ncbi:hypothetical protein E2562_027529 [Oryza meyeriana var. granulata]|uniref:MADS-box domain-containing protein n=1 Tax=Oryza meyeriana var. granulata TaxID=110450 RepID=A0A6G1CJ52_9ORYZ|nr:hypothetical protein E2562_027529 [Oryza meyeriana var. granulata]
MARGKVQLRRIENPVHRQVTFCKRRAGLLKKARELSVLCDADIGIIIFSAHGKLYDLATTGTMEELIERYKSASGEQANGCGDQRMDPKQEAMVLKQEINLLQKGLRYIYGNRANEHITVEELNALERYLEIWMYNIRSAKEGMLKAANEILQEKIVEQNGLINVAAGGSGYGGQLHTILRQRGLDPELLRPFVTPGALDPFAALAFTSRSGISAFSRALPSSPPRCPISDAASALPFTVAALGSDADLLDGAFLSRLCRDAAAGRVSVLVPDVPTSAGLVEALGSGSGRRVLCPVPDVVSLREPPVVPGFLAGLEAAGWVAVRAPAYITSWAGRRCAEALVAAEAAPPDAVVFTSTADGQATVHRYSSAARGADSDTVPGANI